MIETIRQALITWNGNSSDKQKLQHTYLVLLFIVIFVAGIVALFSGDRSRELMYVALIIATTLVTNFVVWGLLKSTLLDKLPTRTRTKRQT